MSITLWLGSAEERGLGVTFGRTNHNGYPCVLCQLECLIFVYPSRSGLEDLAGSTRVRFARGDKRNTRNINFFVRKEKHA